MLFRSPTAITYGTSTPANGFTTTGLNGSDSFVLSYTYAGTGTTSYAASTTAPTAAGTYSITPAITSWTSGSASTYSSINYVAGSLTINKKALTVTPDSINITYGTASPSYTFSVTGFKSGEDATNAANYSAPSCTSSGYSATNAATTTSSITCSGGSATNYSFTTTATATVTQAPLVVAAEAKSVTYGEIGRAHV